jgi:hypothetical protein
VQSSCQVRLMIKPLACTKHSHQAPHGHANETSVAKRHAVIETANSLINTLKVRKDRYMFPAVIINNGCLWF